jgi:hypothetical protein
LRLRGLYLAISTLALYFVVVYIGGEYESTRGFSTGIMIDAPRVGGFALKNPRAWYFVLLAARGGYAADLRKPLAQPHRPGLARDPRSRDCRRSARHRHCRL